MPDSSTLKNAPRTVLVSAYLSGDDQRRKLEYFERLDAALRARGYALHLVNLSPKTLETTCVHTSMPYLVPYAPLLGRLMPGLRAMPPEALREAVDVEAGDMGLAQAAAFRKLLFFRAFMRKLIRREAPALCILWHQFNGLHHAFADLLREAGVPFCYAEFGLLPGTIAFDRTGQMAESAVALESEVFARAIADPALAENAAAYLDKVRLQKRTRRTQPSNAEVTDLIRHHRAEGRPVLFFAGENGYKTGMLPAQHARARIHSPFFESTAEALREVAALAEKNNWHVVFKPHPLATDPAAAPEAPNECVTVVRDANIFDCLNECDVTLTILSQVNYLALLHGRPVVLLGRSPLSEKACAYEIASRDDLEATLALALEKGLTPDQQSAWKRHCAQLCEHYLYALDEDVEQLIARGPEVAAEFLLRLDEPEEGGGARASESALSGTWGADAGVASPFAVRLPYAKLTALNPLIRLAAQAAPAPLKRMLSGRRRWF